MKSGTEGWEIGGELGGDFVLKVNGSIKNETQKGTTIEMSVFVLTGGLKLWRDGDSEPADYTPLVRLVNIDRIYGCHGRDPPPGAA